MEVPEDFEPRVALLTEQLTEATQGIGLYVRQMALTVPEEDSPMAYVLVEFTLGDLAFSERVQHPEVAAQNEETRQVLEEAGLGDTDAEIVREQWEERKRKLEGGG
jgi:hypothetical protein